MATDNPEEIGEMDVVVFLLKHLIWKIAFYSCDLALEKNTILLPLLNGVDSTDRIKTILPNAIIWEGLVYIISRLTSPGVVQNFGNIQKLYFGFKWNAK